MLEFGGGGWDAGIGDLGLGLDFLTLYICVDEGELGELKALKGRFERLKWVRHVDVRKEFVVSVLVRQEQSSDEGRDVGRILEEMMCPDSLRAKEVSERELYVRRRAEE